MNHEDVAVAITALSEQVKAMDDALEAKFRAMAEVGSLKDLASDKRHEAVLLKFTTMEGVQDSLGKALTKHMFKEERFMRGVTWATGVGAGITMAITIHSKYPAISDLFN